MGFADEPAGFYLDLLGGVGLLLLAVAVLRVRPHRPLNTAFAAYAAAVGLAIVLANAAYGFERGDLVPLFYTHLLGLGGASLLAVAILLDRSVAARRTSRVWPYMAFAFVPYLANQVARRLLYGPYAEVAWTDIALYELEEFSYALAFSGVFALLALVAVRTRTLVWSMSPKIAALLALGVGCLPAFAAGSDASYAGGDGRALAVLAIPVLAFLVLGALWLAAIPRVGRPALFVGLGLVAATTAGVCSALARSGSALETFVLDGSFGVFTFLGLACLAYALLRHQLFDIDIRVKWTIKRGTMAALFLAVFFVVAQVAQNFLSTRYGWGLGGAAAGLMLFAIAPIQRAAERLSDRALPDVRPHDPAYVRRKKRETYRNAYAAAWSDGQLSAKDARLLAEFKLALALPEGDYADIERDWARTASS